MDMAKNITNSSSDEDYDLADLNNYDDDKDDDEHDVITPLDWALMTNTSFTFLHHVNTEPTAIQTTSDPKSPSL